MIDSTLHNLPELSEEYKLSNHQIEQFRQNGHIHLKDAADEDEIAAYRPRIVEMVQKLNRQTKSLQERDTYGKAFIQISNIWVQSEAVKRFVLARRFAKIAADLMGVKGLRIYHDQALFKESGGGHTPWHQDQIYWPLDTDKMITMWMPLVPVSEQSGTMTFASGSHLHGYISKLTISDQSHKTLKEYIEHGKLPTVNYGAMSAGDATFHYGWTLHSAPGNPTDFMREVMTVIYYADGARIIEPDSNARRSDMEAFFPGLKPGDLAASHLTPLAYSE